MPRNYIRKTERSSYPKEKLLEAVAAVRSGALSGYAASKHYGIPRATIINRVYDRKGVKSNTLGRATVLSQDVEENLVKNLHIMEKYGFGLTRKELMETVGLYVEKMAVKNPFKNGVPGEDWFLSFKKRHNLSVKKPQPVEYARKNACRPNVIYPYFDLLEETVDQLDLRNKPSHIWNVDETSFSKDPFKSKVVGLRGFTSTRTIASPGKDNTTVLLGCNALGEKAPPLIIFKGKNVWDEWTSEEGYPGTAYAATSNGWMETAVFEAWFEKVFLPTVGQKRPILLVYDGHSTHVGVNIIEKARAAKITILKIPPHTSDVLQPLDLAVNKSFKDKWDAALVKWQRSNIGKQLPKKEFAKILGQIWTAIDSNVCAAGFRKAGIYPLDKYIVPESKFNQILLQEWKQNLRSNVTNFVNDITKTQEIRPTNHFQSHHQLSNPSNSSSSPDLLFNIVLFKINSYIHQTQTQTEKPKSKVQILENRLVTFEDLLLMNIKAGTNNKLKRKKIATGAEVITHDDVYRRSKQIELERTEKLKQKQEKKAKANRIQISLNNKENNDVVNTAEKDEKKNINASIEQKLKRKPKTICTKKDSKKIKKVKKNKKSRVRASSISTSGSEMDIEICDDSDNDLDYEQYCEGLLMQEDEEVAINNQMRVNSSKNEMEDESKDEQREDTSNLKINQNDWLLVKFCTKQFVKHYVGVVLHINDDGVPVVKYVRKTVTKIEDQTMFTYPTLEDISEVKHHEDIVAKLPKPVIGRRGQIIFKMSFQNFNVQ